MTNLIKMRWSPITHRRAPFSIRRFIVLAILVSLLSSCSTDEGDESLPPWGYLRVTSRTLGLCAGAFTGQEIIDNMPKGAKLFYSPKDTGEDSLNDCDIYWGAVPIFSVSINDYYSKTTLASVISTRERPDMWAEKTPKTKESRTPDPRPSRPPGYEIRGPESNSLVLSSGLASEYRLNSIVRFGETDALITNLWTKRAAPERLTAFHEWTLLMAVRLREKYEVPQPTPTLTLPPP